MVVFANLSHFYHKRCALRDINLSIPTGALLAITGPNGAGKTTLLKIIAGLIKPTEGSCYYPPVSSVAYLPQQLSLDRNFPLTVREIVAMGFWSKVGSFKAIDKAQEKQLDDALRVVGMADYGGCSLASLSGGQFQRVLFARLMIQNAEILLLDEPFAAVDEHTTIALIELMQLWHRQGKTIIAVMHNANLIKKYFTITLILAKKIIAYGDTNAVLNSENVLKSYFLTDSETGLC